MSNKERKSDVRLTYAAGHSIDISAVVQFAFCLLDGRDYTGGSDVSALRLSDSR